MEKVLLIGAGPMAVEYAKVLKALDKDLDVVGRSELSASTFTKETGITVTLGGIENYFNARNGNHERAIVAVGERQLGRVVISLIRKGVRSILVEKPGGYDFNEIRQVADEAFRNSVDVFVAYNRRFYASVRKARNMIEDDGGVTSFNFEFTEWSHVIRGLTKEEGVKEEWLLHNSTHVIDLAFFLGGDPKEISCYKAGELDWHPTGSVFAGAGVSENGALFSYQANWEAPGRWGVEILTKKHRLILKPLEKLQVQKIGSVSVEEIEIDDNMDKQYKPGLYLQVIAFIEDKTSDMISIREQLNNLDYYKMIAEGSCKAAQIEPDLLKKGNPKINNL